ncbi:hypothetical protein HPP92_018800 [Vanilla planifolia]|uniref:Uncharacterized protein n=1 Tax=Vanilla planifolia TaxID=51239 RepID=A0A835UMB4_VANPL|nr:hypothetical protein HPP92_018800 [Vanilla planifolia]
METVATIVYSIKGPTNKNFTCVLRGKLKPKPQREAKGIHRMARRKLLAKSGILSSLVELIIFGWTATSQDRKQELMN